MEDEGYQGPLSIAAAVLKAFGISEACRGGVNDACDLAKALNATNFNAFCMSVDCMYGMGTDRASVVSVYYGRSEDAIATCEIRNELNGFTFELHS